MTEQIVKHSFKRFVERIREIESTEFEYQLSKLSNRSLRNEKLFQLEFLKTLSDSKSFNQVLPEKLYENSGSEKCDVWCTDNGTSEIWIEIKTLITNYHKKARRNDKTRPITDQKNSVIADINRLLQKEGEGFSGFTVVLTYPLFPDSEHYWNDHKQNILDTGVEEILSEDIRLKDFKDNSKAEALLYRVF